MNRIKIVDREFLVDDETLYWLEMAKKRRVYSSFLILDHMTLVYYRIDSEDGEFVGYHERMKDDE